MANNECIRSDFEALMAEKSLSLEKDMLGDYHASYVHAAFQGFEAACANPPKCVRDRIIREFLNTPQTSGSIDISMVDLTGVVGYGVPGNVVYREQSDA